MIYYRQMLASPGFACLLVLAAAGSAIGQESGGVARTTAAVGSPPLGGSVDPSRVLRFKQEDGLDETVVVAPGWTTVWHFHDKVVSHVVGDTIEYPPHLDKQKKRLAIQPISGASPTNLNIETKARMTFNLVLAKEGQIPVSMVIIEPPDPEPEPPSESDQAKGEPSRHDDSTRRMEQGFEIYRPKKGHFELGLYKIEGELSAQYREGDTLKCRYSLSNVGLHLPIKGAVIIPHGSHTPLTNVTISVDGSQTFPFEFANGAELSGSIHVKEGARFLERGFTLHLISSRMGIAAAPVGFKDPPVNEGRWSVRAHGTVGAMTLQNSADAVQEEAAFLRGVGVDAVRGLTKYVSVEASVTVLTAGDARFDDDATADVTSLRALGSLRLELGDKYVPYLRGGLGVRTGDFTWTPSDGPADSEWRSGALLAIGLGVDAWVRESFVIGVSAGYVGPIAGGDDESFSFEAGAHAGYAWKP